MEIGATRIDHLDAVFSHEDGGLGVVHLIAAQVRKFRKDLRRARVCERRERAS